MMNKNIIFHKRNQKSSYVPQSLNKNIKLDTVYNFRSDKNDIRDITKIEIPILRDFETIQITIEFIDPKILRCLMQHYTDNVNIKRDCLIEHKCAEKGKHRAECDADCTKTTLADFHKKLDACVGNVNTVTYVTKTQTYHVHHSDGTSKGNKITDKPYISDNGSESIEEESGKHFILLPSNDDPDLQIATISIIYRQAANNTINIEGFDSSNTECYFDVRCLILIILISIIIYFVYYK